MARPFLPDELRKEYRVVVRLLKSEENIVLKRAEKHNAKSISEYIRKLIREDISKGKRGAMLPDIC